GAFFTISSKLSHCTDGGRLGALTTSVGVDFGIQNEHIDIVTGSQNVIQTAVTNVISPAVTTHDPNTLFDQVIRNSIQLQEFILSSTSQDLFEGFDTFTLFIDTSLVALVGVEQCVRKLAANQCHIPGNQFAGDFGRLVHRKAHAQTKLSIIFKQRVRPGRSLALLTNRPWGGGLVAAIN